MDFYKILGVSRTATVDEIKKTFRKLALLYHPDVTGNDKVKTQKYSEISKAYETLSDIRLRRMYDEKIGVKRVNDFYSQPRTRSTSSSQPSNNPNDYVKTTYYAQPKVQDIKKHFNEKEWLKWHYVEESDYINMSNVKQQTNYMHNNNINNEDDERNSNRTSRYFYRKEMRMKSYKTSAAGMAATAAAARNASSFTSSSSSSSSYNDFFSSSNSSANTTSTSNPSVEELLQYKVNQFQHNNNTTTNTTTTSNTHTDSTNTTERGHNDHHSYNNRNKDNNNCIIQ